MHMLIWNFCGHVFSSTPSLILGSLFSTVKTKYLDQTGQTHMHAHAGLELCWSDVSWASLYVSLKFFFFFFFFFLQKSGPTHISLSFICSSRKHAYTILTP